MQDKLERAKVAYKDFSDNFKTLQMATVSENGVPNVSYSPYVKHDGCFYIYVSELSEHTKNLMSNPVVSIFFIQNEEEAKHLFARRRLTYNCDVKEVSREDGLFNQVISKYAELFNEKFINMLKELEDFHLYQLQPNSGIFVNGFGQAFDTIGENMSELIHKNEVGHRSSNEEVEKKMNTIAD